MHTCPNCGYCPHCGRSNAPVVPRPVWPGVMPFYPPNYVGDIPYPHNRIIC